MESADFECRLRAAQRIIDNPHPYYLNRASLIHTEPLMDWILRTLVEPHHFEDLGSGRLLYWGSVPEVENWLLVIVQDGQLFNAYLNRQRRKDWGRPS